jgi:hypothetical protein
MRVHLLRIAVAALALFALGAQAAQQRSFVASNGLDTNACNLANPCRSFNTAIGQTFAGGEVVILDTAGYGPMLITKAIKVIGPSGVYGGISVVGNAGPTVGVTINALATDVVILRGLDISGVPTAPFSALPNIGIDIISAQAVHIEKTSISNFTQDTSACIHLDTATAVQVFVVDSLLRECRNGISVNGSGPDNPTRPLLEVDNTRIERGLNTAAVGVIGVRLTGNFFANIRNSIIAYTGDALFASNSTATAASRAYVVNSQLTQAGNAAIETAGGNNASLVVNVSNSQLNGNAAALLHGHGGVRLTTNVITNNTNSLVVCGGNPASVESLGYGSGIGSNLITDFMNAAPPAGCTGFIAAPTLVQAL